MTDAHPFETLREEADLQAREHNVAFFEGLAARDRQSLIADEENWALAASCTSGAERVAAHLLAHGADPNRIHFEETCLNLAINYDHASVVTLLLDHGADPLVSGRNSWNSLHKAATAGAFRCLELLIPIFRRADTLDHRDRDGKTALQLSVYYGDDDLKTVEALVAAGAELAHVDAEDCSLLHDAVLEGRPKVLAYLLGRGVAVTPLPDGRQLLEAAPTKRIKKLLRAAVSTS